MMLENGVAQILDSLPDTRFAENKAERNSEIMDVNFASTVNWSLECELEGDKLRHKNIAKSL